MRFTFYKNSVVASIMSILGALSMVLGIAMLAIFLFSGELSRETFPMIFSFIAWIAAGFGLQLWASRIAEKKAQRQAANRQNRQ